MGRDTVQARAGLRRAVPLDRHESAATCKRRAIQGVTTRVKLTTQEVGTLLQRDHKATRKRLKKRQHDNKATRQRLKMRQHDNEASRKRLKMGRTFDGPAISVRDPAVLQVCCEGFMHMLLMLLM
eukprot:TRINITY_DN3929_c0_g1_i1.p2 TRINITY_DN3929_c0_g1~~TRINITY_DN3929_c0_g1_i1.p2  ORF type:complete len:125 (+),score=13.85 TRINITY_DN3929_c0_g1_i1:192-566(+)